MRGITTSLTDQILPVTGSLVARPVLRNMFLHNKLKNSECGSVIFFNFTERILLLHKARFYVPFALVPSPNIYSFSKTYVLFLSKNRS